MPQNGTGNTNNEQTNIETLEVNKIKITFNVDAEALEEGIKKAFAENKGQIALPGFRKGKAPRKLIEVHYGKDFFYEDAVKSIFPALFDKAVEENNLEPVSRPEIEVLEIEAGVGATIAAEVYLKPKAKVGAYKGVKTPKGDLTVTEEDIARELDTEREKNARLISAADRPVKDGDITTIDFEGFLGDVPFEGGKGEDYELTIGSGRFIPGFEEGLIGAQVGETRDVNVTFPAEYHAEQLKGAEAVFKVTVKDCRVKELPEADDDFAQNVSDFETINEYREDIKAKLSEKKAALADNKKKAAVAEAIENLTEVDIPEPMIDSEINHMVEGFRRQLASRGLEINDFLRDMNMTMAQLAASYKERAKANITVRLALETIAEAENLAATDEEMDAELKDLADKYEMDVELIKNAMSPKDLEDMKLDVLVQKALDLVVENAVETDEPIEADKNTVEKDTKVTKDTKDTREKKEKKEKKSKSEKE